jgi:hypothetical protein
MATGKHGSAPLYPRVRVQLVGLDGDAFSVLGRVTGAMRAGGLGDDAISAFLREALGGSYEDLLAAAARWVDVCGADDGDDESE